MGGGTDTITDLSSNDVLIVGSGATANANDISSFTQIPVQNAGTANLTAASMVLPLM